jgi:acyl-CoA synthetase (AMP-forming)/AMP-acid ligase II
LTSRMAADGPPVQELLAAPDPTRATLVAHLVANALARPDSEAACFIGKDGEPTERITRGELHQRARSLAAALRRQCASGDRVLLLYPPGLEFVTAFTACLYAGVVAVPAPPPHPTRVRAALPRLAGMVADCAAALALTTNVVRPALEAAAREVPALADLPWLVTADLEGAAAEAWDGAGPAPDELAFLQYTSGSTAVPKGVMVSHRNLLANLECLSLRTGLSAGSRLLSWQPHYHDMGLIGGILGPLFVGGSLILMPPPAVLQSPLRWLAAIDRYRATHSGGPNFAFELCVQRLDSEDVAALDLSSWECAFCGAEPVRARTLARFAAAFAPQGFRREAFTPCYGLAEATLMVSSVPRDGLATVLDLAAGPLETGRAVLASPAERQLVSCGPVVDGHRLAIVDTVTAQECPPGQVGEIWVSGPSVAQGYWNRPQESRDVFAARLDEPGSEAFLRTGDLGLVRDGELFITGRIKDLIIVAGRNHYPQDIEATAETCHSTLHSGCAAAFPIEVDGSERLAVAVELDRSLARLLGHGESGTDDPQLKTVMASVRYAVAQDHGVQVSKVILLGPGGIPRTSSGKVRRHACRLLFEERPAVAPAAVSIQEER